MSLQLGDSFGFQFVTSGIGGALVNADSTPTATLVRNGDDTATSVTVTNVTTGTYKVAATIPSGWSAGDNIDVRVAVTIDGVASGAIFPLGQIDTPVADLSGSVSGIAANASTLVSRLSSARASALDNLDAAVSSRAASADVGTLQTTATAIKAKTDSLTFTIAGQVDSNAVRIASVLLGGDGATTPVGRAS